MCGPSAKNRPRASPKRSFWQFLASARNPPQEAPQKVILAISGPSARNRPRRLPEGSIWQFLAATRGIAPGSFPEDHFGHVWPQRGKSPQDVLQSVILAISGTSARNRPRKRPRGSFWQFLAPVRENRFRRLPEGSFWPFLAPTREIGPGSFPTGHCGHLWPQREKSPQEASRRFILAISRPRKLPRMSFWPIRVPVNVPNEYSH